MTTAMRILAVAALLAGLPGCAGVMSDLVVKSRDDLAEATGEDAATLIITPMPGEPPLLTGVTEPSTCRGTVNLGRPYELTAQRTFKLTPGKEFGYLIEGRKFNASCYLLTIFTPAPRAIYRADVKVTDTGCSGTLLRIEGDLKIKELTHYTKTVKGWERGELNCP